MKLKGEIHLFLIRLAFLLVFLWVLFGLLFGITTMKNNDMSPRISAGDLLFYYRLEKPKSGDVVVLQKAGEKYVGRVIAAGGDTVEITEDEKVKINGSKIAQEQNNYRLEHTFYLVGQESQAEGMTARIDVTKEQTATVTYTNQYQPLMVVPTGVENRMFPTILMETAGITGGAVFLFLRRKRKEKDS